MMQTRWSTHEATAFADAAADVPSNAITACQGWTAHDVLAHAVAGGGEIARLVGSHVAGDPVPPTMPFEEREPMFRALSYEDLVALVSVGGLFDLLHTMAEDGGSLEFTGWAMDADTLALHVRSELAVHRWDLVGSDDIGVDILSQPELTAHAVRALGNFDVINERAIARTAGSLAPPFEARLRVDGAPDVVICVTSASTEIRMSEPDDSPALTTDAAARLLLLWGRRPPMSHRATSDVDVETLRALHRWLW